jgi:hypothetical protein
MVECFDLHDMQIEWVRFIGLIPDNFTGFFNFIKKARTLRVAVFVPKNSDHCFY